MRIEFTPGEIAGVLITAAVRYADHRGWLLECFRTDELAPDLAPKMAYVSLTHPGVARGPHLHQDQTDLFVFQGPSDFRIWLWDARPASKTHRRRHILTGGESNPIRVIVPPGVVHAYRNVGAVDGVVFNAPNRLYAGPGKKEPVDEERFEGVANSPYRLDEAE